MPDLRISVDPETLSSWVATAAALRKSYTLPITLVSPIAGVATVPQALFTTGERFLLEVGKACSRPDVLDDPARLFAVLRYGRTISAQHQNLTLAAQYHRLDSHKKKVLSDELGCGMAFLIATEMLGAGSILDLNTAVELGLISTGAPRSKQPDYIALLPTGHIVVLEAKGTQRAGRYSETTQIPTGCQQVSSVRPVGASGPGVAARVVVATSFYFEDWVPATTVYIGDPDEADPQEYVFHQPLETTAVVVHYLRYSALVGDTVLASKLTGHEPSPLPFRLAERDVGATRYVGSQVILEAAGARLGVFVGLERELRDQLLADVRDAARHRPAASTGAKLLEHLAALDDDEARLRAPGETVALGHDGTVWVTWIER